MSGPAPCHRSSGRKWPSLSRRRAGTSRTASRRRPPPSSWRPTGGPGSRRPRRSASRSSTRRNSCAAHGPNPKLASQMSVLPATAAATEALTIGRAALRQLHDTLSRDAPDLTVPILQEVGFAAGGVLGPAVACTLLSRTSGVPSAAFYYTSPQSFIPSPCDLCGERAPGAAALLGW